MYDRGYLDYDRFCEMKRCDEDFVTLLRSDARVDVLERVQDVEIIDESGIRSVCDQRIELAETGEEFRRVVFEDVDGEEIEYLTRLSPVEYDPVDVVRIYTLRTLIEILLRELKQYTNTENFYSQSLNGVLFEFFCTLIGYVLMECPGTATRCGVACRKRSGSSGHAGISRYPRTAEAGFEVGSPPP